VMILQNQAQPLDAASERCYSAETRETTRNMKIYRQEPEEASRTFDRACNRADDWRRKADDLLSSEQILCDNCKYYNPDPDDPFLRGTNILWIINMLRAMAVECLLKGLWVHSGGALARNGIFTGVPGAGDHKLRSLAEKVDERIPLNFSNEQLVFLDRLSFWIAGGRYPVRKHWQVSQNIPFQKGASGVPGMRWVGPQDDDFVVSVITTLQGAFERQQS
jgi:hypothetical protein